MVGGKQGHAWLGVSKGMLVVKYFCFNKASPVSVEFCDDDRTATKMRYSLASLSFEDITGLKIVVSVYLYGN